MDLAKGKLPYFLLLQMGGYSGRLYPVNPKYEEINGVKAYQSINDLPGGIDLAIVAAPVDESLKIITTAVRKEIKFIHFFTSGFSEEGNHESEKHLIEEARKGVTRIVGPNCIGVHCPRSGICFDIPSDGEMAENFAFISQSGGTAINFKRMAESRKIGVNKAISYGNQIDVKAEDYVEYFSEDDSIKVIAGYVEDLKDPRNFLRKLKKATRKKPVVLFKGGMTREGAKAAASHTGALASNYGIWSSAIRQHGGILVENMHQVLDVAMIGSGKRVPSGPRVAFLGAGGGAAVSFTDIAVRGGLTLPELHGTTQERIKKKIRHVNTSTNNPVDLGVYGFDFEIMSHAIESISCDGSIDVIIPYFSVDFIANLRDDQIERGPQIVAEMVEKNEKPVVPIVAKYTEDNIDIEKVRIYICNTFRKAGLPVFSTIQDAVYAIGTYLGWTLKVV